jgi:hypothetical protein
LYSKIQQAAMIVNGYGKRSGSGKPGPDRDIKENNIFVTVFKKTADRVNCK